MGQPNESQHRGENRRNTGRSGLLLLAAIGLLIGLIAVGQLTSPDLDTAAPTTSTTTTTTSPLKPPIDLENFSVDQIETGSQLEWTQMLTIENVIPHELLEYEDLTYLVASPAGSDDEMSSNPTIWRSADGRNWESLGATGPERTVSRVFATERGLLMFEASADSDHLNIWSSTDGLSWEASDGIPVGNDDIIQFHPSAVAATEDVVVVAGESRADATLLGERWLMETIGSGIQLLDLGIGWNTTGEDLVLQVSAPLGLIVDQIPASELGLSDGQQARIKKLASGGRPVGHTVWSKRTDGDWTSTEIDDAFFFTSIHANTDEGLVAFGYSSTVSSWRSQDGVQWTPSTANGNQPQIAEKWGDVFVGIGQMGADEEVLFSTDSFEWEAVGLGELIPSGLDWRPWGIATGDGGLAVMSETSVFGQSPQAMTNTPTLEKDGHTLTLSRTGGLIIESGEASHSYPTFSNRESDHVEFDLHEGTVTFNHSQSGDAIVTVTFEELRELDFTPPSTDQDISALFSLSTDGETWSLQGIDDEIGPDGWVYKMEVTSERVVILVVRLDEGRPAFPGDVEIWTADIPEPEATGTSP